MEFMFCWLYPSALQAKARTDVEHRGAESAGARCLRKKQNALIYMDLFEFWIDLCGLILILIDAVLEVIEYFL